MACKLWIINTYIYCSTDNLNIDLLSTRDVFHIAMALIIAGLMRPGLDTQGSSFYYLSSVF